MKQTFCKNCGHIKTISESFLRRGIDGGTALFCSEDCHLSFLDKARPNQDHICITCDKQIKKDETVHHMSVHGYSPICDSCFNKRSK